MTSLATARRRMIGATRIGIGISRGEIRFVGVNHVGLPVWNRAFARHRGGASLADLVGKGLAERPAMLRGRVRVACVVGPVEAQLRPLHGLPVLRSSTEQLAVVNESVDRFFVSEDARMRISPPVRARGGELWAAAVNRDVVNQVAEACRAHRVRLVGVTPVAAALGHLIVKRVGDTDSKSHDAKVRRVDDGTRLHLVYDASGLPVHLWRERVPVGLPDIDGDVLLPERLGPSFADAYAATCLRARDHFVIGEHSNEVRRARLAQQRTRLWAALAAASLVSAAWLPGALATRRADRARTRLASLATRQRDLIRVQAKLGEATAALNSIASFEASRRSATIFLAELALALPDSTAVTTLHADSLGGSMTLLAPRAAGALETVSEVPLVSRVQTTGPVTREIAGGTELERTSLKFVFQRRPARREAAARDSLSRIAERVVARGGAQ